MDYSEYKMTDYKWVSHFSEIMGDAKFFKLLDQRYEWLLKQKPGWRFDISASKVISDTASIDLLIKTVCLFISEGHGDYQFSRNYNIIRRL